MCCGCRATANFCTPWMFLTVNTKIFFFYKGMIWIMIQAIYHSSCVYFSVFFSTQAHRTVLWSSHIWPLPCTHICGRHAALFFFFTEVGWTELVPEILTAPTPQPQPAQPKKIPKTNLSKSLWGRGGGLRNA